MEQGPASHGLTLRDVAADKFIAAYAAHLKKSGKLKLPEWVEYVKTAPRKELAPYDQDWYYIRAASVARKVYLRQGLGIASLARIYGGNARKGVCPKHFERSARGLLRNILTQLEEMGIVEKREGAHGGRKVTSAGRKDLDRIAHTTGTPVA